MKLTGDSRPRHEEIDKQIRPKQKIKWGRGLVNTILTQNSKSDWQTDTGTSWFAPQIKKLEAIVPENEKKSKLRAEFRNAVKNRVNKSSPLVCRT